MPIVARKTWGMPGPLGPAMNLPAQILYLHHSVTAAANGYAAVRTVANIGVQRFGRASYSYACTPDGTLYELQGTHIGAHTAGQNSTSLAVVLVGNYETTQISNAQIDAVAWLHRHLTSTGKLRAGAPLRGHRDAPGASTACPGRTAYAALPTIRSRITSTPKEDDMSFTDEDRQMLRELHLGRNHKRYGSHYIRDNVIPLLSQDRLTLIGIVAARFARDEDPDQPVDVDQLATEVAGAVVEALPAALSGLTPDTIASAVVDALPEELARQVVAEIGTKLSEDDGS